MLEDSEDLENLQRVEVYRNMTPEQKNELRKELFKYSVIDYMREQGYLPYIYNGCYGGPEMSIEGEYLRSEFDPSTSFDAESAIVRCRIVLHLGDRANSRFSRLVFTFFKSEVYDFIELSEYDGLESVRVNLDKYKVTLIEQIIDSNKNSEEKAEEIRRICKRDYSNVTVKYEDARDETNQMTM